MMCSSLTMPGSRTLRPLAQQVSMQLLITVLIFAGLPWLFRLSEWCFEVLREGPQGGITQSRFVGTGVDLPTRSHASPEWLSVSCQGPVSACAKGASVRRFPSSARTVPPLRERDEAIHE